MGADFIWAYVPAARITSERGELLKGLLGSLSTEDLHENSYPEGDPNPVKSLGESMKWYEDAARCRETSCIQFPGMKFAIYLSGGMSYGDTPTSALDHMIRIGGCQDLWQILEKWAKEDVKEKTSQKRKKR